MEKEQLAASAEPPRALSPSQSGLPLVFRPSEEEAVQEIYSNRREGRREGGKEGGRRGRSHIVF